MRFLRLAPIAQDLREFAAPRRKNRPFIGLACARQGSIPARGAHAPLRGSDLGKAKSRGGNA
jgi:hypothetical protein